MLLSFASCDAGFSSAGTTLKGTSVDVASASLPASRSVSDDPSSYDLGTFVSATLNDGSLFLNGTGVTEIYHPQTDTWTSGPSNNITDSAAVAPLSDGNLFVTGGWTGPGGTRGDVYTYDVATSQWISHSNLLTARHDHIVTQLADGTMFVAGGDNDTTPLSSCEIFDGTNWTSAAAMSTAHDSPVWAHLDDDRVLVAGGFASDGTTAQSITEIYTPSTHGWAIASPMPTTKADAASIVLRDGRVLSAGGARDMSTPVATAEIFDPATNAWHSTGSLLQTRYSSAIGLLPDGRVIVSGGYSDNAGDEMNTTEIYDPSTGAWTAGPTMTRSRAQHAMSVGADGTVVLQGGRDMGNVQISSTEVIDLFPTKIPLEASGGAPPYSFTLKQGTGFIYDGIFYSGVTGAATILVTDSTGASAPFTINVH